MTLALKHQKVQRLRRLLGRRSAREAEGVFVDTQELIRLWTSSRRVFLVVRRPRGQSVVAALPPARVYELGRYGSRWLYSNSNR